MKRTTTDQPFNRTLEHTLAPKLAPKLAGKRGCKSVCPFCTSSAAGDLGTRCAARHTTTLHPERHHHTHHGITHRWDFEGGECIHGTPPESDCDTCNAGGES